MRVVNADFHSYFLISFLYLRMFLLSVEIKEVYLYKGGGWEREVFTFHNS